MKSILKKSLFVLSAALTLNLQAENIENKILPVETQIIPQVEQPICQECNLVFALQNIIKFNEQIKSMPLDELNNKILEIKVEDLAQGIHSATKNPEFKKSLTNACSPETLEAHIDLINQSLSKVFSQRGSYGIKLQYLSQDLANVMLDSNYLDGYKKIITEFAAKNCPELILQDYTLFNNEEENNDIIAYGLIVIMLVAEQEYIISSLPEEFRSQIQEKLESGEFSNLVNGLFLFSSKILTSSITTDNALVNAIEEITNAFLAEEINAQEAAMKVFEMTQPVNVCRR